MQSKSSVSRKTPKRFIILNYNLERGVLNKLANIVICKVLVNFKCRLSGFQVLCFEEAVVEGGQIWYFSLYIHRLLVHCHQPSMESRELGLFLKEGRLLLIHNVLRYM